VGVSPTSDWFATECLRILASKYSHDVQNDGLFASQTQYDDFLWNGVDAGKPTNAKVIRLKGERLRFMNSCFGGKCVIHFNKFRLQYGQELTKQICTYVATLSD
jgi:hypothetical protein